MSSEQQSRTEVGIHHLQEYGVLHFGACAVYIFAIALIRTGEIARGSTAALVVAALAGAVVGAQLVFLASEGVL